MITIFNFKQRANLEAVLLCCTALVLPASHALALTPVKLGTPVAHTSSPDTLRVLTYNTWTDRYASKLSDLNEFMRMGDYDLIGLQEPRVPSNYVTQWPGILSAAGLGTYTASQQGDTGILSKLPGTFFSSNPITATGHSNFTAMTLDSTSDRPQFIFASTHLQYYDDSTQRMPQAQMIGAWAKTQTLPVLLVGDFNAGDVSERGLERASQIALMLPTAKTNAFYHTLLTEYATAADPVNGAQNLENYLNKVPGAKPPVFQDETYPVKDNIPVTLNVLKKSFLMLQLPSEREHFAPLAAGDGASTWTSVLADSTNTWPSWDHVSIDHFLVSRPFGKWWALVDDPADTYLGVLSKVDHVDYTNGTTDTMSDHDLVAHTVRWIGPILQNMTVGTQSLVRLVWNASASTFAENGGVFALSRNNMRTDVYLGQIADDSGNPIMTGLTLAQKETVLNCASTDPTLQVAIQNYCIDDHSLIGETLINDNGTVAVTEDLALGNATATLRLGAGTLRIDGTTMTTLNRPISLEAGDGTILISDATNTVTIPTVVAGVGGLHKAGPGGLVLSGKDTYTGKTNVDAGLLRVDGSIVSASSVNTGGTLEVKGTVADVTVNGSGILKVDAGGAAGAVTLAGGIATADGTIGNTTINTGTLTIDAGGKAGDITTTGGTLDVGMNGAAGNLAVGGGEVDVAGKIGNANVTGGTLGILANGVAADAAISSGTLTIAAGGAASTVSVTGGRAQIDGKTDKATLSAGELVVSATGASRAVQLDGGTATIDGSVATVTVNAGATLTVSANANVSAIAMDGGNATLNGPVFIANVGKSAYLNVATGSTLNNLDLNGGSAMVNGVVTDTAITGGSTLEVAMGGGTLAANVSDGLFKLDSGGAAGSVTASGNGIASIDGVAGDVVLNAGGELNGRGSMQTLVVNAGGIVAPGHSIGTLHVNGDVTYNPGSIYQVEVDADGNSDSVEAGGTAHLNGGTVAANASSVGEYQPETHYQVLEAKGGVAGAFDKATSNLAYLTPSLIYGPNNVELVMTRNDTKLADVAGNSNQASVGAALEPLAPAASPTPAQVAVPAVAPAPAATPAPAAAPPPVAVAPAAVAAPVATIQNPVMRALLNQTPDGARRALDSLGGEGLTGTQNAAMLDGAQFTGALGAQAEIWRENPARDHAWSVWATGFGASQTLSQDLALGAGRQSNQSWGGAAGADNQITPGFLAGFSLGGSSSRFSVSAHDTSGSLTAYHVGAYALLREDASYLSATVTYGHFDNDTLRGVNALGLSGDAAAHFGSEEVSARIEIGRDLLLESVAVTPFAAIDLAQLQTDRFVETVNGTAQPLALSGVAQTNAATATSLGLRFRHDVAFDGGTLLRPYLALGWRHAFASDMGLAMNFAALPGAFNIRGAESGADGLQVRAGADLLSAGGTTIYVRFDGDFAAGSQTVAGNAGIRLAL